MRSLGFPSKKIADMPPPETAYDNARAQRQRHRLGVHALLRRQPREPGPGAFPDGAFAYTFDLFGPYTVTT